MAHEEKPAKTGSPTAPAKAKPAAPAPAKAPAKAKAKAAAPAKAKAAAPAPAPAKAKASSSGRAFRPRELTLPDGGKLVLHSDGSIAHLDTSGSKVAEWATGDAEWARHAIRFGVLPQEPTIAPADARTSRSKPHGA